jgi:AraC-like DNA-binding protein
MIFYRLYIHENLQKLINEYVFLEFYPEQMADHLFWFYILVTFFCLLGLVISLILYLSNRNESFAPKLLSAILFCISYSLFGYLLYISKAYRIFPHLFRTPLFMSLCVAPLTYIYVRSSLEQAFHFKKKDFWFFIPAVLYTAQFIPFYLLPASQKLVIIEQALQSKAFGARESEGMLPPGLGVILRMVYSLVMVISTYVLLIRWRKSNNRELLKIHQNNEIFQWLVYLSIVMSSTFLVLVIGYVFQISYYLQQFRIPSITVTLTIFFICAYLLFKPNILYGLKGWLPLQDTDDTPELTHADIEPTAKRQSFTVEQGLVFKNLIESHFTQNFPFIKHRYSIRDLSAEIDVPSYLLSAFINQEYGKNFSEFINENRVAYLIGLASQNPEHFQNYTLEVIGQMGGFKSRASFIAAVKRKTGKTPSEVFGNSAPFL